MLASPPGIFIQFFVFLLCLELNIWNKKHLKVIFVFASSHPDHPDLLLPTMLEEFPFLHVSPQTAHSMWQIQERHLNSVLKLGTEVKTSKTQRMIEEAERRQEALVGILKKDLDHNLRMV